MRVFSRFTPHPPDSSPRLRGRAGRRNIEVVRADILPLLNEGELRCLELRVVSRPDEEEKRF